MKKTVDFQMFLPAQDNVIDILVGMMELFGMDNDAFICIFQKVRQYRTQRMVTVGGAPVEIKMR